jgi:hypothetical protein
MTPLKIALEKDRDAYEPEEQIAGSVTWIADESPHAVELRLFWFTRGKGTEDVGLVETLKFDQPLPQEMRTFRLRLPAAPYSFSGKLISLVWALELIVYPSKEVLRREIEMGPLGREVRLESLPETGVPLKWISRETC